MSLESEKSLELILAEMDQFNAAQRQMNETLAIHTELLRSISEAANAPPSMVLTEKLTQIEKRLAEGNALMEKVAEVMEAMSDRMEC